LRFNPAVTTTTQTPPLYEEIKDWIKPVSAGHELCPVNPRTGGNSGWCMPDGAVIHPRSDSSDTDEYVDMKSFLGDRAISKLGKKASASKVIV
jgi:hypothetical protein